MGMTHASGVSKQCSDYHIHQTVEEEYIGKVLGVERFTINVRLMTKPQRNSLGLEKIFV